MLSVAFRKTSLVDYPGKVSSVIFFPLCNLRCPWCHNRELVLPDEATEKLIDFTEVLTHLEKRKKVLGGVVLTGGEPLLRPELGDIIKQIRQCSGLSIKLDTNGTLPDALEQLVSDPETRPDYVAMDLKLHPDHYAELGLKAPPSVLERSAQLLRWYNIEHEFRSLALPPEFFDELSVSALSAIAARSPWYFSPCRFGNCLDESWNTLSDTSAENAAELAKIASMLGANAMVR